MFRWEHILIKWLFTSLALLFSLSHLGVSSKIEILFLSDFSEVAGSIISLAVAVWLDVLSEFGSLVPQCNIMWSGSKSRTVGFAWLCIHLTLAKLNGQSLTRHLRFSFLVSKKRFYFLTMLATSMKTVSFEVGGDRVLLNLLSLLLLLLLLFSLLLPLLLLLLFLLSILLYF